MRETVSRASAFVVVVLLAAGPKWVPLASAAQQHDADAHRHAEAAKGSNPVAASAKSVADGSSVYSRSCASCHGKTGMGDGPAGRQLDPKPSNLADAEWIHGTSDSEIFATIRSGIPKTSMKGFASKLTEHEIWDVINYLRSIGPKQ
jgi:mono/diheme cytochrome c family protein